MKDNAMTVKDVADYLKLSQQMVYNMVRYEELPSARFVNFIDLPTACGYP